MSNLSRSFALLALSSLAVAAGTVSANAAAIELDCRTGCTLASIAGDTSGVLWSTASVQPSGTGVFKPFVRIHAEGNDTTEDGHNTSGAFANQEMGGIWTHDVKFSELDNIANIAGTDYYEFMLDMGEPSGNTKSYLSLDMLKVCFTASGNQSTADNCPSVATYDLDHTATDRAVLLDYDLFKGGNGNSDLFVYIPATFFAGANANDYFYFYSGFGFKGGGYAAEGTFEEWAFQHRDIEDTNGPNDTSGPGDTSGNPTGPVPEPGLLSMLGAGLAFVGYRLRRRS